jgi:hypothetical protein
MSDGFKSGLNQVTADVSEAVVQPVVDEVGKAIEEGVQSIVSGPKPVDPAAQQKKQQDLQKRKDWALKVIEFNKQLQSAQQRVRDEQKQKITGQQQEEQEKQQIKQYEIVKKQEKDQQMTAVQKEAHKTEIKGGVGG